LEDTQNIVESIGNSTTLGLSDNISIAEEEYTSPVKGLSDTQSINESLVGATIKALAESLVIEEQFGYSFTFNIADGSSINESLDTEWSIERQEDDSISIAESLANITNFGLEDNIILSESFRLGITLSLKDALSIVEVAGQNKELKLTENLSIKESRTQSLIKRLEDNLVISENIISGLILELSLSNTFDITEALVNNISIITEDNLSVEDSNVFCVVAGFSTFLTISEILVGEFSSKIELSAILDLTENLQKTVGINIPSSLDIVDVRVADVLKIFEDNITVVELVVTDSIIIMNANERQILRSRKMQENQIIYSKKEEVYIHG